MPSTEGLKPIVISDFSPGLYNSSDWLVPAKGWQQMENCCPQIGGGLRAFYNVTEYSTGFTGISDPTHTRVLGIHASGGLLDTGAESSGAIGADRYLVLYNWASSTGTPWVYRYNGTVNDFTQWVFMYKGSSPNVLTSVNDNNPSKASLLVYVTQASEGLEDTYNRLMVIMVRYNGPDADTYAVLFTDDDGVLDSITPPTTSSGDPNPPFSTQAGSMCVHQQRLVFGSGNGVIIFTDPAATTYASTNFLAVDASHDGTRLAALYGIEPGDLACLREGAGMVVVQGDLLQGPVVVVSNDGVDSGKTGYTDFCSTPYGLAFISADGYVYLTDGRTTTKISEQISAFEQSPDFSSYGDLVYMGDFLFCPGERVYDFRTKSWFTQTAMAGHVKCGNDYDNEVFGTQTNGVISSNALVQYYPQSDTTRQETFTAQTAPIHGTDGRTVAVRMVEVNCKTYDANATIAVTVHGTTKTRLLRTVGKQNVRFLFNEQAETLDATFVSTSGTGAEAPSFDDVVLWTRSGHFAPS